MPVDKEKVLSLFRRNHFSEPQLQEEIYHHGKLIIARKGDMLIRKGQQLNSLCVVVKGTVRVYQDHEDREILLYYVQPGQTCMMSLSSAYLNQTSTANGIAMEACEILLLPIYLIAEWQVKYKSWNNFIINTFGARYDELVNQFTSVTFNPVQMRLINYLKILGNRNDLNKIKISHQILANELGTTREVVSRILKHLEREKYIKMYRGAIELRNL